MTDAITRIEASVDTLTSAVSALIANQAAITAQLRAAAASVPDADTTIQLNALADKLDADTAAINTALGVTPAPVEVPPVTETPVAPSPAPEDPPAA